MVNIQVNEQLITHNIEDSIVNGDALPQRLTVNLFPNYFHCLAGIQILDKPRIWVACNEGQVSRHEDASPNVPIQTALWQVFILEFLALVSLTLRLDKHMVWFLDFLDVDKIMFEIVDTQEENAYLPCLSAADVP